MKAADRPRHATCCALLALLASGGCHLFGAAEVPCETHANCFEGQRCHPERQVCVAPGEMPSTWVDAGGGDVGAGVDRAQAPDVSAPDSDGTDQGGAGRDGGPGDAAAADAMDAGFFDGGDGGMLLFFDDFDRQGWSGPVFPTDSYWVPGFQSGCLEVDQRLQTAADTDCVNGATAYAYHLELQSGGGGPDGRWRLRGLFSLGAVGAGGGHRLRLMVGAWHVDLPYDGRGFAIDSAQEPPTLTFCTESQDGDIECQGEVRDLPALSAAVDYYFELSFGGTSTRFTLWQGGFEQTLVDEETCDVDLLPAFSDSATVNVMLHAHGASSTSTHLDDIELRRLE